jgi:ABC-type multidrug transport system ATPase subunit
MAESVVRLNDVDKSFGSRQVLRGCDLEVAAGECVAIVGENGSGKTTLLNLCAGFLRPERGTIDISTSVGLCPQTPGLVELLTAEEHLRLLSGGSTRRAEAYERCRKLLERLGFDDTLDAPVKTLSGGTRQKLNLALALANDPRVILLDEPYQGFDYGTYVDFWGQLDSWREAGRTLIVVTHLLAEQQRVDRVLRLIDGRLED